MTLDEAAAQMALDEAASMGFYHLLAGAELVLLLLEEPAGNDLAPQVFDLASGRLILAFDSTDRLAAWAQTAGLGPQPYAILPGRVIAQLATKAGNLGLGLNFGAGTASEMILPAGAMTWLAQMLETQPKTAQARAEKVLPLGNGAAQMLAVAQVAVLGAGGLANRAVLAKLQYDTRAVAHVLAFFGTQTRSEAPLARAVAEALAFSNLEAAALDVIFPVEGTPLATQLTLHGLSVALPAPPAPADDTPHTPPAPGMDKTRPPKLR